MKKTLCLFLIGVITTLATLAVPAADPPSEQKEVKKNNTSRMIPFNGKLAAVDLEAQTITVGKRTFHLTTETKIYKDDKLVSLSKEMVGERVGGAYVKAADGNLEIVKMRVGAKPDRENESQKNPGQEPSP
jgi:hypothetical protein